MSGKTLKWRANAAFASKRGYARVTPTLPPFRVNLVTTTFSCKKFARDEHVRRPLSPPRQLCYETA